MDLRHPVKSISAHFEIHPSSLII